MGSASFPWLPVGFALNDGYQLGRVVGEGEGLQLCEAAPDGVCLLLDGASGLGDGAARAAGAAFLRARELGRDVQYRAFTGEAAPMVVGEIPGRTGFYHGGALCDLARAMAEFPDACWGGSVYFPAVKRLLPIGRREAAEARARLAVSLLTSGVSGERLSARQIRGLNPWVTPAEIGAFFAVLGVEYKAAPARRSNAKPVASGDFCLPGQPALEKFFRERIIDFFNQREAFEKMQVSPVNGVILHGIPGTGKTYAVNKLAEFLQWPKVEVNLGEIGSKYIHETSARLRRKFSEAEKAAPSVVFLDELDAMGGERDDAGGHTHKIEEINELLKQVESAAGRGILVVAATNRIEAIDRALLRKGRFDAQIKLGLPEVADIAAVLEREIGARPHAAGLDFTAVAARLANRTLAEVGYFVNEAARLAVVRGLEKIDAGCLEAALAAVAVRDDGGKFIL